MKEVCIVNYTSNAAVYGIGTYLAEYVYCLNQLGYKTTIVELGTDDQKSEFYVKEDGNKRTIHFPYIFKGEIDRYNKGVCRVLRFYLEDSVNLVFHLHYWQSDSLLDSLKTHFPQSKSVYTIHYSNWSASLQGNVALLKRIIHNREKEKNKEKYGHIIENYKMEKTFLEKFDRIVCLSDDRFNLIQRLYGIKEKVWLIPNGLRKNARNMSEKQKLMMREKFHISKDEKILLFVGRIESFKGIKQIIHCLYDLISDYPAFRLVVIGNGDINGTAKKCNNVWSKVTFTGRLDKKTLYKWYQIADIALFPSFFEECSYVGIEMLMHGLKIVASDGFGVRNMFHDDRNAKVARIESLVVKSKFEKNLKRSILGLFKSDLTSTDIKNGAKESYQSKYSIEMMQEAYEELFNSL